MLAEVDEFISNSKEGKLMDAVILSTAYQKMKTVVWNIRNEVLTDIEIHRQNVFPRWINHHMLHSESLFLVVCLKDIIYWLKIVVILAIFIIYICLSVVS